MKQTKEGHCEQCGRDEDEIMRFSDNEEFRCSSCMRTEGLCQECGEYIPFPDDDDYYDMNFAPNLCDECEAKKNKTEQLNKPRTNIQEVLYTLINNRSVSCFDFPYLQGFRTRVSELRRKYNITIIDTALPEVNKFGNCYSYIVHSISDEEVNKCIEVYKQIQKTK